ncbi:MAG: 3-phosphoshikimate 1-carboxyvinyltransferase [Alphaproteobacteria bacterium]
MTHPSSSPRPLSAGRSRGLAGTLRVPGDKSISHRALMLGALALGETTISGLLEGEDVLATAAAMRRLGATVDRGADGVWRVHGVGVGGMAEPDCVLDMGNSGTAARLLIGVVSTQPITCFFTGDASLNKRPMARVTGPLARMGARFVTRTGGLLPLAVTGPETALPIRYDSPVASAQIKSAVILAGLNAPGETTVVEPAPSRDHSENMLRHFGASVTVEADGARRIVTVAGHPDLRGRTVAVPADPSSAAFPTVAALIVPDSTVRLPAVGMNPHRDGLYRTLVEMGAAIRMENEGSVGGEPVADLVVSASALKGVDVPAERAPSMIDEYPVLAVAAACAEGSTRMRGLAELRVKESDRLAVTADGLAACGARVEIEGDDLIVHGTGRPPAGGATIAARLDHRIAMSFLVLGLASDAPVAIDDGAPIDTSFPGFADGMRALGADIRAAGG